MTPAPSPLARPEPLSIGPPLKRLRRSRGVTLRQLAKATGLTPSLLSQVETGKTHPSLGSLLAVLNHLGMTLADFFGQTERREMLIVRADEVETRTDLLPGAALTLLASKLERTSLVTYRVRLSAGASFGLSPLPEFSNGERFLLLEAGRLEAAFAGETVLLGPGDSLNFKAHLPCRLAVPKRAREARFLLSGHPPLFV